MKLEQQTDGTYLASERINNKKVRICEGRNGEEAWDGLNRLIKETYGERIEQFKTGEEA